MKEVKELPASHVGRRWCFQGTWLLQQKPADHRSREDWSTHALGTSHRYQKADWNAFRWSHQRALPQRPWPCRKAQ